jgi:hypothetical protein
MADTYSSSDQTYAQEQMDALLARYNATGRILVHSKNAGSKEIDNPAFLALSRGERALNSQKQGPDKIPEKITVPVEQWQNADVMIKAYREPGSSDWHVERELADATPTLPRKETPEQDAYNEAKAAQAKRESEWNLNHGPDTTMTDPNTGQQVPGWGSGKYETHEARATREIAEQRGGYADAAEQRAIRDQQIQEEDRVTRDKNQQRQLEIQQATEERQKASDAEAKRVHDLEEAHRAESDRLANARFGAEQAVKDRPQVVGTPTDTSKSVAVWNPATGQMESVTNPIYDQAKVDAARLKDQLSTAIALNQVSAQQAAQQYKQWWDTNVTLPFQQAQEVRARAAEQRAALEAEDRRKQFASQFSLQKASLGQQAGNQAVQNEISLLPYRAGPNEAADMSSAINSLGAGGKVNGPDASAGIHFQASDFQFDRPDFDKIASQATAKALKGLTKYSPSGSFSQGDYSGVTMPTGQGAPSSTGAGIDTSSLWQQYQNIGVPPYTGPPSD